MRLVSHDLSLAHPLDTLSRWFHHPVDTAAEVVNAGAAAVAMTAKTLAEDVGLPVYGRPEKKVSDEDRLRAEKILTGSQNKIINYGH